jgi:hypothetical protein
MEEGNWSEFLLQTWSAFQAGAPAEEFSADFTQGSAAAAAMWEVIADGKGERWPASFMWWRIVPRSDAGALAARLHARCAALPFRPLEREILPPFGALKDAPPPPEYEIQARAERRGNVTVGGQTFKPYESAGAAVGFAQAVRWCLVPRGEEGWGMFFRLTKLEAEQGGWESFLGRWWNERSARAIFEKRDKAALLEAFTREVDRETAGRVDRQLAGADPNCVGEIFQGNKPPTTLVDFGSAEEFGALEWLLRRATPSHAQPLMGTLADAERVLPAAQVAELHRLAEAAAKASEGDIEVQVRADPAFAGYKPHELFEVADALIQDVAPAVLKLLNKAKVKGDPVCVVVCGHL